MSGFRKFKKISGHKLTFVDAAVSDAPFILGLRLDPAKGRHLSVTPSDLQLQIQWLENYRSDTSQLYYVILDPGQRQVGTVRLYDQQGDSFCWGSWILIDGVPAGYSVESCLMVYQLALRLGFRNSHFSVRRENTSVCRFHEQFGASRVSEHDDEFRYQINNEAIKRSLTRFNRYLPAGIQIEDTE
ncbi:MAG: GNAT family N-acetyltransferase [Planctomycetia bacterium]